MRRKLAAGNWKMNGTRADLVEVDALIRDHGSATSEVLICPPATLIHAMSGRADARIAVGAQDCHAAVSGAHTGDVSAAMLADAGASHVITGHSERRADHGESDATIAAKTRAVWGAGLVAIVCIGETLAQRQAGDTLKVIGAQLAGSVPDGATGANTVIAYEPVWAIGTGEVATVDQIAEVHDYIRAELASRFGGDTSDAMRILYGGSVKPGNAAEIFATSNVDGALVGGASLKASDFGGIITALDAA